MIRIAHLSDFHFDGTPELHEALDRMLDAVLDRSPDLVVITGDLTAAGRADELDAVLRELERLGDTPRAVIPGNRDLEPSVGPPGEGRRLPIDSDLEYFLTVEPALSLGLAGQPDDQSAIDPGDAWSERLGGLDAFHEDATIQVVGVPSTPRLRSSTMRAAADRIRRAPRGALRVFAIHHGLLPIPGRKLRDGDLTHRAGDLLALLCDLEVDVVLHGHIHRAHCWQVSDGRHQLVVASAGALVNDGRRDASFVEVLADDRRLEIWRRSVAHGEPVRLFEGRRQTRAGQGM